MHLIAVQPIDHPAACLLQLPGIFDIAFLIKSRPQLHQNDHFFSVLCRFHQSVHNLTFVCETIQRHLDGYDRIIFCRLIQQIDKGFDTLERIRQQHILFHDLRNQRALLIELCCHSRCASLIKQIFLIRILQITLNGKYKGHIERNLGQKYVVFLHLNDLAQGIDHFLVQLSRELHSHRIHPFPLLDQIFHRIPVIQILVIDRLRVDVRISCDAQQRFLLDLIILEHLGKEMKDQLFREHERPFSGRDINQTLKDIIAAGNDGGSRLSTLCRQQCNGVDIFIFEKRKRLLFAHNIC